MTFLKTVQEIQKILRSSLFKSSSIYTLSSFLNASIPFLLLPILTNKLSPADYGIVAMFQLAVSVIYPFVSLNLEGAVARKYYDKDKTDFASYIGTCIALFAIAALISSIILFLFPVLFEKLTLIDRSWAIFAILVVGAQFLTTLTLTIFQVKVKPISYGILQVTQTVLNIFLTILLVVVYNKKWIGRLEAQIITGIFFAIISILILFTNKLIKFNLRKKYIIHALKFGIPLIPHALGGIIFTTIDRYFLANLVGLDQTGNYTVAYQLGAVIGLLTISVNNAFVPWLFENLTKNVESTKEKIVKGTYLYFVGLIFIALATITFLPVIIHLFIGKTFTSVNLYTTFIVFGFVFQGMYYMVTNYITYINKTYLQAILTLSVASIKIPITYYSIMLFGAQGAAISYCLTFFIYFITTWMLSAKTYKMPWGKTFRELVVLKLGIIK